MITQETAKRIWSAHREIVSGEKLIEELRREASNGTPNNRALEVRDAFGQKRPFTLGVPNGDHGHQLLDVAPSLAESVIRAHIAEKRAELVALNERARLELDE